MFVVSAEIYQYSKKNVVSMYYRTNSDFLVHIYHRRLKNAITIVMYRYDYPTYKEWTIT